MNIRTVDLNLFLVFQAIYVTRNVTKAGEHLNMTQSAVSNALKRLRERFDDPLFLRTQVGMVPTPLADALIDLVEEGLHKLTQAIDKTQRFDPATTDRLFRIAINDIGQLVLLPGFLNPARAAAPFARFETVGASSAEEARALLLSGKVDIAIGSWLPMGPGFQVQVLCEETFVALIGRQHSMQSDAFTYKEYLQSQHVTYRPSGASDAALQDTLYQQGILAERNVVLTMAHALGAADVAATSDLVLSLPMRLAGTILRGRSDLRSVRLPFHVGPFPIWQQWHDRFNADPANLWLRELAFQAFLKAPLPA
ncbi:LysR family transcriptional regulator [Eoetvoesiella caeni]|uniref:LysR family transcriptional regulator n=1 Tax=Eoetvoesiella caeni TaxID=645616 RepID=A0A366H7Y8_9BURK|nr:LysR family transcriptional regulator [Eoetvoesiella caeni]MCI2809841.1 LysR family transcriptional regulator [Eoetvoesiella caeni]NYT56244.1 LysR family transcriptional regulator [Eoetvoesiella caeni]RBP38301.1 LysR family transcriptional regulator [Eoetvoesiella caeni]